MDLALMAEALPQLLAGVGPTVALVAASLAAGFCLALPLALAQLHAPAPVAALARGYVVLFRGTPLLVQLFLIYYGLGQFASVRGSALWPILREPWWCAILALTLNTAAYTGEIVRGGILSVPFGQVEAARAFGMSRGLLFRRIIAPLALRQALPAYSNEVISMVKASSLASTVTILEVTGIARKLIAVTYKPVEIFVVAGAIYLAINFLATRALGLAERRLAVDRAAPGEAALSR